MPYARHFHEVHIGQSLLGVVFPVLQSGSTVTHLCHGLSSHFWRRLRGSLGPQCGVRDILRLHFLLGLEPRCSSFDLSEFVSHWRPYGGLLGSSVEFTSLHSLFTLTFHSSVHVPYTVDSTEEGHICRPPGQCFFIFYFTFTLLTTPKSCWGWWRDGMRDRE